MQELVRELNQCEMDLTGKVSCPVCSNEIVYGQMVKRCNTCGTYHHLDCQKFNQDCAIFGCDSQEFNVCMFDGIDESEINIENLPDICQNNIICTKIDPELLNYLDEYKKFLKTIHGEEFQIKQIREDRFWSKQNLKFGQIQIVTRLHRTLDNFDGIIRKSLEKVAKEELGYSINTKLITYLNYFKFIIAFMPFLLVLLIVISICFNWIYMLILFNIPICALLLDFRIFHKERINSQEILNFLEHAMHEPEIYLPDCEYLEDKDYAIKEFNEQWYIEKNGKW